MGVYVYNLRKATKTVNVDGEFVTLPTFKYAYKFSGSGEWGIGDWGRRYRFMVDNAERTADEAWAKFSPDGGPILAVSLDMDGTPESVWLITRALWEEEVPGELIGRVAKVGNRWYCVAQEVIADLAFNARGYDYDAKTGKATRQAAPVG
jgi:hypothetical protein